MGFRNSIIVMTSNIGSDLIKKSSGIGFAVKSEGGKSDDESYERMKTKVMDEVKRFFRPEFLNRIDGIVVFHSLGKEHIHQIVDLMLQEVSINLLEKGISLEVTQAAKDYLVDKGYDPDFGARPLRRVIQDEVEDKLSEELLGGKFGPGDTVVVDVDDGQVVVSRIGSKVPLPSG